MTHNTIRGFSDADIEQAEMERIGDEIHALHARGICTHGWVLGNSHIYSPDGVEDLRKRGQFPDRPTSTAPATTGTVLCLDCGQRVEDPFAG